MKVKATVQKVIDNKTCKCIASSFKKHARYGKYIMTYKKYLSDTSEISVKEGDQVELVNSRPISKRKRWKISSVLNSVK